MSQPALTVNQKPFKSSGWIAGALFLGVAVAGAVAQSATDVNFSTAEGYTSGALSANSNWGGSTSAYTVSAGASSGTMTWNGTAGTANAIVYYQTPIAFTLGTSFTVSMDFTFGQVNPTTFGSSTYTIASLFLSTTAGSLTDPDWASRLVVTSNQLQFATNGSTNFGGASKNTVLSTGGAPSSLGDGVAGDVSDKLRMTITLTEPTTAGGSWSYASSLLDLTQSTTVSSLNGTFTMASSTAYNQTLYLSIRSPVTGTGESFVVTDVSIPLAVPEPRLSILLLLSLGVGLVGWARRGLMRKAAIRVGSSSL